MWKANERPPYYHFSWIVSFQKQRYNVCKMLPLETKLSRGKLLPQSDLRRGVFLEEMSCKRYDKKECKEQKEHHSYKTGTWNVRTLNQGGKLENLQTEMQKSEVSVLGVIVSPRSHRSPPPQGKPSTWCITGGPHYYFCHWLFGPPKHEPRTPMGRN